MRIQANREVPIIAALVAMDYLTEVARDAKQDGEWPEPDAMRWMLTDDVIRQNVSLWTKSFRLREFAGDNPSAPELWFWEELFCSGVQLACSAFLDAYAKTIGEESSRIPLVSRGVDEVIQERAEALNVDFDRAWSEALDILVRRGRNPDPFR